MKNIISRRFLLFLLTLPLIFFFDACEKEKNIQTTNEDQFPSKLYPVNSIIVDTKVYSRNGEVTDPVLRADAFETTGLNIILRQQNRSLAGDPSFIQFSSRNSFLLEAASYKPYTVTKTDSLFEFADTDTSTNWVSASPADQGPTVLANPFYKYPQFTQLSSNLVFTKRQFSGYGSYNAISLRGLDFCMIRRDSVTKAFIQRFSTISYNEFNTSSAKYLGKYDTITVRRYDVNYAKR